MRKRLDSLLAGLDTSDEALGATNTADLKRRRREVNGIIKSVDDGRKAIKREYNRSLDAFEAEVKDVLSTARDASDRFKAEIDKREAEALLRSYRELVSDGRPRKGPAPDAEAARAGGKEGEHTCVVSIRTVYNPARSDLSRL